MIKKIRNTILIAAFSIAVAPLSTRANDTSSHITIKLPAMEIKGNYILPDDGIDSTEARKIIVADLKKLNRDGDINAELNLQEITTKEVWNNMHVQLFKLVVHGYWLTAVAVIKDKKVVDILPGQGMPMESIFIADLDNDGVYELYINYHLGSGLVSEHVFGYNIISHKSVELSARGEKDYRLYEENGTLMTEVWCSGDAGPVSKIASSKVVLKVGKDGKEELTAE